ncbi:MAG TPA: hypothetical protein VK629_11640 [Steroidobacteraceae bacterium]|nr:hypothetical protein [Steroidobacteraceae bacterium]
MLAMIASVPPQPVDYNGKTIEHLPPTYRSISDQPYFDFLQNFLERFGRPTGQ